MSKRRCKAKAKSTGKRCQKRGNRVCRSCGVCRVHGCNCGTDRGAPEGNQNALKHGIYSKGLLRGEEKIWDEIPVGTLVDEIRVARLQLRRALIAQARAMDEDGVVTAIKDGKPLDAALMQLEEIRKDGESLKLTHRRPDYWDQIYRLLGRIQRLEQAQSQLEASGTGPLDPAETAREIKSALDEMMELVEDAPAHA